MYQGRVANSLQSQYPDTAALWDYDQNYPLKPNEIAPKTATKVYWKCPICMHEWESAVNSQIKSKGCPRCNNQTVSTEYNFATLYPELLAEWNYEKNTVNPYDIMPFSHDKRYWICKSCGSEWPASTAHRINGTGCVKCGAETSRQARLKAVEKMIKGTDTVIEVHESARDANMKTGISYKHISACCNNQRKSAGGYSWKFVR